VFIPCQCPINKTPFGTGGHFTLEVTA